MSLVGYLIYSIDHRGVYYVFIVFEEVFVGTVHLIHPIISLPLFPSLLTSGEIGKSVCLPRATVCADRICSFWGSAGLPEKEPWIE